MRKGFQTLMLRTALLAAGPVSAQFDLNHPAQLGIDELGILCSSRASLTQLQSDIVELVSRIAPQESLIDKVTTLSTGNQVSQCTTVLNISSQDKRSPGSVR